MAKRGQFYRYLQSKEESNSLSVNYLKIYCSTNEKLDRNTWTLFWNCKQINYTPAGGNSYSKNEVIPAEAKELMKDFVINKDLDGFLYSLRDYEPFHHKKFKISDSALYLFGDWQSFETILKEQDEGKWLYLKEFKAFFEVVKAKNFIEYIDFKFEIMPVQEIV